MRWDKLLLLIPLLLLFGCLEGTNMAEMETRGGALYKKGAKWPFTGKAVSYFTARGGESPRIFEQGELVSGLRDGKWTLNKWNGEWEVVPYRNGKRHGEVTVYYRNGERKSVQEYSNDRPDGVGTFFDPSGEPVRYVYYKDGSIAALPPTAKGDVLKKVEALFGIFSEGFKGKQ